MTTYYDIYTQRWHDYVDIMTSCQARGIVTMGTTPESLLAPFGPLPIDLLLSWYNEGHFFDDYDNDF